jgi:hypothetical protein
MSIRLSAQVIIMYARKTQHTANEAIKSEPNYKDTTNNVLRDRTLSMLRCIFDGRKNNIIFGGLTTPRCGIP